MVTGGIGYLIKSINDKLKVKADVDLKSSGLTFSQTRVLAFLNMRGGQATQKELENHLEVSHPTVVGIVSRMEQNGFLATWFDVGQRSKMISLTQKAQTFGEELDILIQKQEQYLLKGFSPEEAAALEKALAAVYDNLK